MKLKKVIAFVTVFAITAALLPHSDAVGTVKAEDLGGENIIAEESSAEDSPIVEETKVTAELMEKVKVPANVDTETAEINATSEDGKYEYSVKDNNVTITKYLGTDVKVVIPDQINGQRVTKIGEGAFYGCDSLTSINIPDSVINIGKGAFEICRNLESVMISNSVSEWPDKIFEDCYKLKKITLPTELNVIGESAFHNCRLLSEIVLPESVTEIKKRAFAECALENIIVPANVKK